MQRARGWHEPGKLKKPEGSWSGWSRERQGASTANGVGEAGVRSGTALYVTLGAGFYSEKEGKPRESSQWDGNVI